MRSAAGATGQRQSRGAADSAQQETSGQQVQGRGAGAGRHAGAAAGQQGGALNAAGGADGFVVLEEADLDWDAAADMAAAAVRRGPWPSSSRPGGAARARSLCLADVSPLPVY